MASTSRRLGFVDQLRGWAVIVMIEVHTFNEWLRADLKDQTLWHVLTFINGLVAPTFITLAGFALALAAARNWDSYTHPNRLLLPRMRYLLLIFAVGYLLHFPSRSWSHLIAGSDPVKIMKFYAVDVLQLIVTGLVILHLLLFVIRSRRIFRILTLAMGAAVFLATPAIFSATFPALPVPVAAYLNKAHGSLFPLFPWVGFVFLGMSLGMFYTDAASTGTGDRALVRMGWTGAVLIAAAFIAHLVPFTLQHPYEFFRTSPEFNIIRLGCVMILLSLFHQLEQRVHLESTWVRLMGQESFLVYSLHLVILYGVFNSKSLAKHFYGEFNYLESLIGYLALLLPMFAVAWVWRALKQRSMTRARILMGAIVVVTLAMFFFVL